jgi:toprim domain protein
MMGMMGMMSRAKDDPLSDPQCNELVVLLLYRYIGNGSSQCNGIKGVLVDMSGKVIVVEGKTDRKKLLQILDEDVEIVCTYGTLSDEKVEEIILPLQNREVYVLVDADESGNKLRKQLRRELPNARHLYTRKMYGEVATTPIEYLLKVLVDSHFEVKGDLLDLLQGGGQG